jgi:hypothetical protein
MLNIRILKSRDGTTDATSNGDPGFGLVVPRKADGSPPDGVPMLKDVEARATDGTQTFSVVNARSAILVAMREIKELRDAGANFERRDEVDLELGHSTTVTTFTLGGRSRMVHRRIIHSRSDTARVEIHHHSADRTTREGRVGRQDDHRLHLNLPTEADARLGDIDACGDRIGLLTEALGFALGACQNVIGSMTSIQPERFAGAVSVLLPVLLSHPRMISMATPWSGMRLTEIDPVQAFLKKVDLGTGPSGPIDPEVLAGIARHAPKCVSIHAPTMSSEQNGFAAHEISIGTFCVPTVLRDDPVATLRDVAELRALVGLDAGGEELS